MVNHRIRIDGVQGKGVFASISCDGVSKPAQKITGIGFFRHAGTACESIVRTFRKEDYIGKELTFAQPKPVAKHKTIKAGAEEAVFFLHASGKTILYLDASTFRLVGPTYEKVGNPLDPYKLFDDRGGSAGIWCAYKCPILGLETNVMEASFSNAVRFLNGIYVNACQEMLSAKTKSDYETALVQTKESLARMDKLNEFWEKFTAEDYMTQVDMLKTVETMSKDKRTQLLRRLKVECDCYLRGGTPGIYGQTPLDPRLQILMMQSLRRSFSEEERKNLISEETILNYAIRMGIEPTTLIRKNVFF